MITLRMPDGSERQVPPGVRPLDVAESIGKRLAQAAIAAKVNGEVVDLTKELTTDGEQLNFQILTDKDTESLEVLRHSSAHIMARAVMRLFPNVKLAFGPALANGFYYDIDSEIPITENDFPRIEAEMKKIIKEQEPFERFERSVEEGKALCAELNQTYKVEHVEEELAKYGKLSFYRQGEFIDLCRGPHIHHAGKVGAFKLLNIAGAYWKGDSKRKQLQRLYATAFFNEKELTQYLTQLEEAKKRDHRVLGKQLKLFTISQDAGQGLILWMPKGSIVRGQLETFIKDELLKRGYQPVYTPHIGRLDLYRTSGHFPYYRDAQYPALFMNPLAQTIDSWLTLLEKKQLPEDREKAFLDYLESYTRGEYPSGDDDNAQYPWGQVVLDARTLWLSYREQTTSEGKLKCLTDWLQGQEGYLLKPMNCPHHIQIYKAQPRSYRDLPVRLAEFGTVYRFEQSGELGGLTRVRGFTQDDAHLFMMPEQIESELIANIDLVLLVLRTLSLNDYRVRVSVREPGSSKYVGASELWDNAEKILLDTVKKLDLNYSIGVGEAAFYGPKIDFIVRDCIGRDWQLGTVQLDYNLPNRFDLEYTGADNLKHRPVMIHRAPFGSMERFCGILIEHFAGMFPLWLAPEQARLLTISEKFVEYAQQIEQQLREAGFRVTGDYRSEKIGAKIRDGSMEKIPYLLVVGEKEMATQTVSLRDESIADFKQRDVGSVSVSELIARLQQEVSEKTIKRISTATAGLSDNEAKYAE
ncbi:MAG: threonine--tRNA ligase [Zavarzinella sp.]